MQKAPNASKRPFSPPSFPARRKRRGRRRRVRNDHGGTSRRKRRLFSSVLVSSFPNRKLNLRFGFYGESAAASQALRASIPTPFVPSGHFPLIGGIGPWEGSLFSATFSSASCRKPARRAAGQKNRPPGPHICPQHAHVLHAAEQKPRNCAHCRRLRPRRRVFCVIFNVLSIKSLNFAGNNAKKFIF